MGFHDRMRAMVIRQLSLQPKGKGVSVTLQHSVPGEFDPSTGGVTPTLVTEYAGSGVRVNYKEYAYKNTSIEVGDFQIYLSPVLVNGSEMPQPKLGDELIFINKTVRLINIEPFDDNGLNCGWKLQVRYG